MSDVDRPNGPSHTRRIDNEPISSSPSTSLTEGHVKEALTQSPDNGASLDLTHRNLTDIGESGLEYLATMGREDIEDESSILRIALGNNRLTTLPMAFALLSRLRYLNLKNNNLSIFPDVLTVMPSLEILDISRNKIKRLPSQPGSLTKLKVFSISRNKLTRLPPYIADFQSLNIFKADHNPIEWPPKSVLEHGSNLEDPHKMKSWIKAVQKWLSESLPQDGSRKPFEDPMVSLERELNHAIEESVSWSHLLPSEKEFDTGITPHARSFSIDSTSSTISDFEPPSVLSRVSAPSSPQLDRLQLPQDLASDASLSPSRSPDSYLPTPDDSVSSADEEVTAVPETIRDRHHTPQRSYLDGARSPLRVIPGKKSLPDLRTAKFELNQQPKLPDVPRKPYPTTTASPNNYRVPDDPSAPSPLFLRQDSGSSDGPSFSQIVRPFARDLSTSSPTGSDRPAPCMDAQRTSYFRRLSSLPSSTIIETLPQPLLDFIDAVRSILFAVSQVYQTLQHYTVYAIDDRLASILRKVLDPASSFMMQLINTLDLFDSTSSKSIPSPTLCRSVLEGCRDVVAVFGKAISVLALQLKVLETHDDVRFLRQMFLILYGATAEISYSWQAMLPHVEAVKPYLRDRRRPPLMKAYSSIPPTQMATAGTTEGGPISAPPTTAPFAGVLNGSPLPRTRSAQGAGVGRNHTTRRNAGSFSSKDVELGKKLMASEEKPPLVPPSAAMNGHVTPVRRATRPTTAPTSSAPSAVQTLLPPLGLSQLTPSPLSSNASGRPGLSRNHSRQNSQSSFLVASAVPSPLFHSKMQTLEAPPPSSKTLVDKETLDVMRTAVEAAPAIWDMIDDVLTGVQDLNIDVQDSLEKAKQVTVSLGESIQAVQSGDPAADKVALREDAHVFVKTVVQLSSAIKTYGASHVVPSPLRAQMVKLTNSTEEFVILLHVSSFASASAPRPYSPMPNGSSPGFLPVADDNRLGSSLSRSRSAQPPVTSKHGLLVPRDMPRSALPTQSFQINAPS